ncbi:MAG: ABC transporter ATP-binding protein [Planctomycetes bacterium]|nr:ABC transporter ATP-binding protein [Planctomycetota bacterium]
MVNLLEGRGLAFEHPGGIRAVDGISLGVARSELVVVCGPNGSGKTTLVGLLAGLLVPLAGEVRLEGRSLTGLPLRERAQLLARVPQELRALPDVSVSDFVLAGRYARIDRWRGPTRKDADAVRFALEASDVADLGRRSMQALSGGQRQRVLLARALAQEAQVLLVDEPTNGLDPEHQVRVMELVAGLACHARAVVVVTHDLNLASQFATRIVLVDAGRVVIDAPPADVLRREVLEPVYGSALHYGAMPAPDGRPFVLPWLPPVGARAADDAASRDRPASDGDAS